MILEEDEDEPVYQTRFEGPAADRARLYRAFVPVGISPRDVDAMTPSQVAACLRLDELDAAEGTEYVAARAVENAPPPERADIDRTLTRAQRREKAKAEGKWQDDRAAADGGLIVA